MQAVTVFTAPGFVDGGAVSPLAVVAAAALPGWLIKQLINWSQLRSAAARLVAYDLDKGAGSHGGPGPAGSKLQELSKTQ